MTDDQMQYRNNWMRYATPEEINAHFRALEERKNAVARGEPWAIAVQPFGGSNEGKENKSEDIERRLQRGSQKFSEAIGLAAENIGDQTENRDVGKLLEELGYFGSTRLGYEYYHACRVIYRIGVEAEEKWGLLYGNRTPEEELLEQLQDGTIADRNPKDEQIFYRLKRAIDEEVADRPGVTSERDGGLRYIFNIEHILENDPWARDVQRKLTSMNQWTNAMMYAYDKILGKLARTDSSSFYLAIERHNNFRGYGYWDNGEFVHLEERVAHYRKERTGE